MDSDFVVGINKAIDAAKGESHEYPAYLHNTLVTEKLDELTEAISEGGVAHASIDELDDVTISNPQGGECIKYNATTQQWENGDDAGNVQSDWNESDPTSGAYILNKPSIPSNIDDLSDVDLTNIQDGMVLKYDHATLMFKAGLLYIEILQADYDLLTYDQKHNGIPYFITDGEPGGGNVHITVDSGTLIAGNTTVTISNAAITANSIIIPCVDEAFTGVAPTAQATAAGSVTLTFPVQSTDMPVKVVVI